ncbi:hypothetical protein [Enterococcus sp. AZ109]|uniref:hypothetical protein n=1 Tax=Enterococcus sp. AZ109 TaxID=2774634 RepID=UPI003F2912C6
MRDIKSENIEESIRSSSTLEEILDLAKRYYSLIPISERSIIFNRVLFHRKIDPEDAYFSLKLATNLSFIFVAYPERKFPRFYNYFKRNKIDSEMQIFRCFVMRIHDMYTRQQMDQVNESNDKNFSTYLNYHFHYPSISTGDYIEVFKLFDGTSREVYGFSIYNIVDILLWLTCDVVINKEMSKYRLTNEWISFKQMRRKFSDKSSSFMISRLFIDEAEIKDKFIYPTDILNNFKGRIGIKTKHGYFVPQSSFVFENILRYLVEAEKSNEVKGKILEKHVEEVLKDYFGKSNVIKTFYDASGNEQDILVRYKKYFFSIECKAQDFKEIYRDQKQASTRLTRIFNRVILKGCQQCERVRENFSDNDSVVFFDSDNKKKRNVVIEIPNTKKVELVKVVVTLDDYLNLSESPHDFLSPEYEDTWIVNLFTLKRILWASEPDQLIEYIKYRTSGLKTIRSINSDELEQYGYFVSPNFNMYPQNDVDITINLQQGFSRVFDEYDNYSYRKQIRDWKENIVK